MNFAWRGCQALGYLGKVSSTSSRIDFHGAAWKSRVTALVSICRVEGEGAAHETKKMEAAISIHFAAYEVTKPLLNLSGSEKPIIVINCGAVRGNQAF